METICAKRSENRYRNIAFTDVNGTLTTREKNEYRTYCNPTFPQIVSWPNAYDAIDFVPLAVIKVFLVPFLPYEVIKLQYNVRYA